MRKKDLLKHIKRTVLLNAALFIFFGLLPYRSQPSCEPFRFTCKEVSPMVFRYSSMNL